MDDADRAASEQELHLARSLDAQRARMRAAKESAFFCIHCGERIPDARRAAVHGCRACIDCAKLLDEKDFR